MAYLPSSPSVFIPNPSPGFYQAFLKLVHKKGKSLYSSAETGIDEFTKVREEAREPEESFFFFLVL